MRKRYSLADQREEKYRETINLVREHHGESIAEEVRIYVRKGRQIRYALARALGSGLEQIDEETVLLTA